jgi:hypothetical protein
MRSWLLAIDDERLMGFGLTPEDIAILRGHNINAPRSAEAHSSDLCSLAIRV